MKVLREVNMFKSCSKCLLAVGYKRQKFRILNPIGSSGIMLDLVRQIPNRGGRLKVYEEVFQNVFL